MDTEKWVVGPEYDEALFSELGRALRELNFTIEKKWNGIGGSQQVDCWVARSGRGNLAIEAETYVGLSVQGESKLVDEVRTQLQQNATR